MKTEKHAHIVEGIQINLNHVLDIHIMDVSGMIQFAAVQREQTISRLQVGQRALVFTKAYWTNITENRASRGLPRLTTSMQISFIRLQILRNRFRRASVTAHETISIEQRSISDGTVRRIWPSSTCVAIVLLLEDLFSTPTRPGTAGYGGLHNTCGIKNGGR